MAPGPLGESPDAATVVLAIAIVTAGLGYSAWYLSVDTSPQPFLPEETAQAKTRVEATFPNATPSTARIVVVAESGENVLDPQILGAIAGLRNRITADPGIAPNLSDRRPVGSVLGVLEDELEGRPGEWNTSVVRQALARSTDTADGRRALASFLDLDARFDGENTSAKATVLSVHFSSGENRTQAQHRLSELAGDFSIPGSRTSTQADPLLREAVRSPLGLWLPASLVLLAPIAGMIAERTSRRAGLWLALALGGSGVGLLAGLPSPTPASLTATASGGLLGTVAAYNQRRSGMGPTWLAGLALVPVASIAVWAPAGVGSLALQALVAGAGAQIGYVLAVRETEPGPEIEAFDGGWKRAREVSSRQAGVIGLGVLVAAGVLVSVVGLPNTAIGGWQGTMPAGTEAHQASEDLDRHFGRVGPDAELAIAAWGPVEQPGFLTALNDTSQRLGRLSQAVEGDSVQTVLSVGRDWASDDQDRMPSDRYDAQFARAWDNATRGGVPVRNVSGLFAELESLDPDRVGGHLKRSPDHPGSGATLVRQRLAAPFVVPRPSAVVDAAVQPLVAASDRVAVGGSALDDARAEQALLDGRNEMLAAVAIATILAGGAWAHRVRRAGDVGLLAGGIGAVGLVAGFSLAGVLGVQIRPLTVLASAIASGSVLALVLPALLDAVGTEASPSARVHHHVVDRLTDAWPALAGLVALAIAASTVPAPGLRTGGYAFAIVLACGGVAAVAILPGAIAQWRTGPDRQSDDQPRGRPVCPECERTMASGVSRCDRCATWNMVQACPAHPDAVPSRCEECDARLDPPRFR